MVAKVAPPQEGEIGRLDGGLRARRLPRPADQRRRAPRRSPTTGATAFAMEAIPRISRAQSMDALSSQATVAGYRAVLIAAQEQGRFFPMLMTAAGTIPPAQVLVLGAGVAGLQAIATARRLGAVVTAFDVRAAVKEQVQSLGAKFLEVEGSADAEARRRLRARADRGGAAGPARRARRPDRQVRRRDHHRARARPPGAEARHRRRRERDEARQRDRRPRRRGGRQLRAHQAGRDVRDRPRRDDRRRRSTCRAAWPSTPRSSTRATWRRCSS